VAGKEANQYNVLMNSCPNAGQLTTSAISLSFGEVSASPGASMVNVSATSSLPLRYVQFFLDGSNSPAVTQEIQDVNPNFTSDQRWLYHATFNGSTIGTGNHSLLVVATDVSGGTKSVTQTFTIG
jgi:hypothetical protein